MHGTGLLGCSYISFNFTATLKVLILDYFRKSGCVRSVTQT